MASAVLMKGMSLFSTDEWMLLISARFVNVLLGALTAWVVLKTAKLLFPRRYAWMFTTLVVFLPGNVIFIFLCQLRRACNVFDGHYLLFLGKGVQRGMELDHVCGIGRWNGNLFLVVLQCVWIYSDDVFLLCGNDADGPVETGQRTMERNDPKGLFILVIVCVILLCGGLFEMLFSMEEIFWDARHRAQARNCNTRYQYKPSHIETFQKKEAPCCI